MAAAHRDDEARYCGVRRASHTLHIRSKHFDAAFNAFLAQFPAKWQCNFGTTQTALHFGWKWIGQLAWSALVLHFLGLPTDRSNQVWSKGRCIFGSVKCTEMWFTTAVSLERAGNSPNWASPTQACDNLNRISAAIFTNGVLSWHSHNQVEPTEPS